MSNVIIVGKETTTLEYPDPVFTATEQGISIDVGTCIDSGSQELVGLD